MPVIITAYSEPIAIINIPVTVAQQYTTKIYWTIDKVQSAPIEFFNITSNRIEIAIFAAVDLLANEWIAVSDPNVQINAGWRVFEITSGDSGAEGNYDSPHIRQVSEPLAEAKISILYHPSYFTDFLLVKVSDFEKASAIFVKHGWHVSETSSTASTPRRRSQLVSPITPLPSSRMAATSPSPPPPQPEITVLSSPLVCVGLDKTAERRSGERIRKFIVWPERTIRDLQEKEKDEAEMAGTQRNWAREQSCTRSESDASACVNELDDPDTPFGERPFISYTRTADAASLLTERRVLREFFPKTGEDAVELQSGGELGWESDSVSEGEDGASDEGSEDDVEEDAIDGRYSGVSTHGNMASSVCSSISTNGHSIGSINEKVENFPVSESPTTSGRSSPIDPDPPGTKESYMTWPTTRKITRPISLPAKLSPVSPIIPIFRWSSKYPRPTTIFGRNVSVKDQSIMEGSFIDTPPLTRMLVSKRPRTEPKEKRKPGMRCLQLDLRGVDEVGHGDSQESNGISGAYHLDKAGLVTRFSDLLQSGGIKMLYSSTYHTANILVDSSDVRRAKRLLQMRRNSGEIDRDG